MKKPAFSLTKLLNNNRFIVVLSVIIAVVAWFSASLADSPISSRTFTIPVNLDLSGTTPESQKLVIIDAPETTIEVRVSGPRNKIGLLQTDSFVATPIFTAVTQAGEHTVPVVVQLADQTDKEISIIGFTDSMKLYFDHLATKTFDLEPEVSGISTAENFRTDMDSMSVSPKNLLITGPETELSRIGSVRVQYKGDESILLEELTTVEGNLVFYDEKGNTLSSGEISHVSYGTDQKFTITIPILMYKEVPVEVNYINQESLDTSKLTYFLDHEYIRVAGPKSVVEKRQQISLDPIDVSRMDGRVFTLPVQLNASELNMDSVETVTISFDQSDWAEKTLTITQDHILPYNTPAGYDVTINTQTLTDVRMFGFTEDIEKLSSKDLTARVDLTDVDESTLRVRVSIWCTGNKTAWAVGEYYVYIEAVKKE